MLSDKSDMKGLAVKLKSWWGGEMGASFWNGWIIQWCSDFQLTWIQLAVSCSDINFSVAHHKTGSGAVPKNLLVFNYQNFLLWFSGDPYQNDKGYQSASHFSILTHSSYHKCQLFVNNIHISVWSGHLSPRFYCIPFWFTTDFLVNQWLWLLPIYVS